jgi:hypothetical protein
MLAPLVLAVLIFGCFASIVASLKRRALTRPFLLKIRHVTPWKGSVVRNLVTHCIPITCERRPVAQSARTVRPRTLLIFQGFRPYRSTYEPQ